jgi:signal transduction histidine kinase
MNSAEDLPVAPRRLPVSGGWTFFVDIGYVLIAAGSVILLTAVLPGIHPLIAAGLLLPCALLLLPLRNLLRRRIPSPAASESIRLGRPEAAFSETMLAHPEAASTEEARTLILHLSQVFHSTPDLDVLLELISSHTLRRIPAVSFRILLAEETADAISYAFYLENGFRRSDREGYPFSPQEDLIGEVLRTGRPLVIGDYSKACRKLGLPEREPDMAWAGFPLPAGASVIGAMLLLRETPFTDAERALLETLAATAGPAVARARLEKETSRRTALLSSLLRASRRIVGSADAERLPDSLLAGARELFPCQSALLLLPSPSGLWMLARQSGEPDATTGFPPVGLDHPFVKTPAGECLTFVERLPEEDPFRFLTRRENPPFRCAVSLPLRVKEHVSGWIVFWNPQRPAPPAETDRKLLHAYAVFAAAALDRTRLREPTDAATTALADELMSLQNMDRELNTVSDPAEAMTITLDWAIRYAEAVAGLAALITEEALEVEAAVGYPEGSVPEAKRLLPHDSAGFSESVQSGEPVLRRAEGSLAPGLLPSGKASLFLPIRRNTQTLGVILLESDSDEAFPPAAEEFLVRLASHAAIAISNAQLYAEVRSANQAKSEFISFVAHELKTPMTSIRGYTDLLAQGAVGPVSQPQANFLSTIRLNVDRMAALVSDLNDVSRIESGRLKLEFSAVALAPAVEEVLEALRSQIEGKEQKLTLQIPSDLPPAWVDRGRLIQILTNLVSNAHKYTPQGGSLRISAEHSSNRWDPAGPPDVVHFLVQDSGLGISLHEQKSVFQKFFRSEDGTVRDLPGTGLGLHITRNLVEMHGGRIWFESELHKGSTFHFTVPAASV